MAEDQTQLQSQIISLGNRMDANFVEIKTMLVAYDQRLRQAETDAAAFRPVTNNSLAAAWQKIDRHEQNIEDLTRDVANLVLISSKNEAVIKWAAGILATLLAAGTIYLASSLIRISIAGTP